MYNNYLKKYPKLKELFESMRMERRDEILHCLRNNDKKYADLIKNRTVQSMVLRDKLEDDISVLEKYMDLVYEQEIYELDSIYKHAFLDAISVLEKLKMLP